MDDFVIEDGVLTKYTGSGGVVAVPDGVRIIGRGAFEGCDCLTELYLPESVVELQDWAFDWCDRLTCVTMMGQRVWMQRYTFDHCDALETIIAPHTCLHDFWESEKVELAAVLGYLTKPELYHDLEVVALWNTYIVEHPYLLNWVFERDLGNGLRVFDELGLITPENFESDYMRFAQMEDAVHCTAFLLDWKNRHIPQTQEAWRQELALSDE